MKTIIEDNKIIVFLNKDKINDLDLNDEVRLEEYFKNIFLKLNRKYNLELTGYYNVCIYKDKYYGIIVELENEDLDYYNYFNQIDMKINVSKVPMFLYEIEYEFISNNLKNVTCYKYLDKLYLDKLNLNMLEFSNIIYGEKVNEILKYGKKVKL